jgi:hypothetical protein
MPRWRPSKGGKGCAEQGREAVWKMVSLRFFTRVEKIFLPRKNICFSEENGERFM